MRHAQRSAKKETDWPTLGALPPPPGRCVVRPLKKEYKSKELIECTMPRSKERTRSCFEAGDKMKKS